MTETIHGITFEWPRGWGVTPDSLGEQFSAIHHENFEMNRYCWPGYFAANCATASLLCRSADIAYDKGVADGYDAGQRDQRWSGITGNGYPERTP